MIGPVERRTELRRRARLGQLDGCLEMLERANEQGVARLSDELCVRLDTSQVSGVHAGMRVEDALEVVFALQEPLMDTNRPRDPRRPRRQGSALGPGEAADGMPGMRFGGARTLPLG